MTSSAPHAQPFAFDTEFDAAGRVVVASQWKPTKRAYSPEEVETLVQEARLQARADAEGQVAAQQAQALSDIANAMAATGPRLDHMLQLHREQAVELTLAMSRQLAGLAFGHLPTGMLETAIDLLAQEIETSPRLHVHAAGLDATQQDRVRQACADAGFTGQVTFREDATMLPAAFELEWRDGRAAFDLDEATRRLREALASQLAPRPDTLTPPPRED